MGLSGRAAQPWAPAGALPAGALHCRGRQTPRVSGAWKGGGGELGQRCVHTLADCRASLVASWKGTGGRVGREPSASAFRVAPARCCCCTALFCSGGRAPLASLLAAGEVSLAAATALPFDCRPLRRRRRYCFVVAAVAAMIAFILLLGVCAAPCSRAGSSPGWAAVAATPNQRP